MMRLLRFFLLGLFLAVATPNTGHGQDAVHFATDTLVVETANARHMFHVELALSPAQRARGLMFREDLAADRGMLFVYPRDQVIRMWMKNTLISLDMLFIDRTGRVVAVHERATPRSLANISSGVPARGVLELPAGTVTRLGLGIGARVNHGVFVSGG